MNHILTPFLVKLVLGIGFATLAFAPPEITVKILGTKQPSRLWVRLAGIVGLAWLLLGMIKFEPNHVAPVMLQVRAMLGGVAIGLLIAVMTKRAERVTNSKVG